jgi:2-phosphosulfolactate phosphatase
VRLLPISVEVEFWARDTVRAVKRGDLIVAIDVLRSSTSILNALVNGARFLIPAIGLRAARELREQYPEYLLAGERGGLKPEGFDFGNSPLEFTSEKVSGKVLVMTTTSGTVAIVKSRKAKAVLVGAFVNASAVAKKAEKMSKEEKVGVSLVLAGDRGNFSLEDFVCAGAITSGFSRNNVCFSDRAQAAFLSYRKAEDSLYETVRCAEHAKHLAELGLGRDVEFSCQVDAIQKVPICRHGRIVLQ